jgi:23S rRNA (pseudouridine1915-N3)-methyltransferase
MVRLHLIVVGQDKTAGIPALTDHYRKLLARYAQLDITAIQEESYANIRDVKKVLAREEKRIRTRLRGGYLIVLDEKGESFTSRAFAAYLQKRINTGKSRFDIIIGGPYGLAPGLKRDANLCLSLSSFTTSHQLARVILLEQLYRAFDIMAGGKYHK